MSEITNLLGQPRIRIGTHNKGEYRAEIIYVYRPGIHNGWLVPDVSNELADVLRPKFFRESPCLKETNCLIFRFDKNDDNLRGRTEGFWVLEHVENSSQGSNRVGSRGARFDLGNLLWTTTTAQIESLLGKPDVKRIEWQLDYYLGRRSSNAADEVFLELHFDENQKLSRINWSEH